MGRSGIAAVYVIQLKVSFFHAHTVFKLVSSFKPTGDQPQAIDRLVAGVKARQKNQTLLGVTGSGKTFTIANVIARLRMPALIISHNKTLAGQLYQEMRDFFPDSGVSYFVSYYDYYQPEAYIPQTDTYIEKEAEINEVIDKLRLRSTTNIMTRPDAIVVASVSCIYNIGSPLEYGKFILELGIGQKIDMKSVAVRLAELQYDRSEFEFKRGTFRVRGGNVDIYPAYEDTAIRVSTEGNIIASLSQFDPLTGTIIPGSSLQKTIIYPAKHFVADAGTTATAEERIRKDLTHEVELLRKANKNTEAERLLRRVNYDLEMIREVGYVNGIENYSRYYDGRKPGDAPNSLLDYFHQAYGDDFLVFIDESHMTVPQIRGMYNGDFSRKQMLVDFGFRLRAAFDNRPLRFEEFYRTVPSLVYTSATPDEWELAETERDAKKAGFADTGVAEQLIRPTGIVDPEIEIRPAEREIPDIYEEIKKRAAKNEKVLVTTLTKKTAEDLSEFLKEKNVRATYLHSDIQTLERSDILDSLRNNEFDVLIGVNLLREGLDLPEVTLVAILDADKEGFLRSRTSLVQTMGRAARNINGVVIMYADTVTDSMKHAMEEIRRRREYQLAYNRKHNITPRTIVKPVRQRIVDKDEESAIRSFKKEVDPSYLDSIQGDSLTPYDRKKTIKKLETEMRRQAEDLNFELAIRIRDKVNELQK